MFQFAISVSEKRANPSDSTASITREDQ
jgi:hypothetical protein